MYTIYSKYNSFKNLRSKFKIYTLQSEWADKNEVKIRVITAKRKVLKMGTLLANIGARKEAPTKRYAVIVSPETSL